MTSTATSPATSSGSDAPPATAAPALAAGEPVPTRGRTELRERAVERLVVAAAGEVHGVAAPVTRVLGQALGSADLHGRPSADVRLAGDLVTCQVRLSVAWPAPVLDVAEQVRLRVADRLADLADLRVGHVDIVVTALPTGGRSRPRVV